ncbi:hypothetical protein AB0F81_45120 [Actinoplanes sp. NPDC024001]|uniref:RCC1-like domain-containing protein n=1 Tax=Actinoplanes sp. NPDC024001 TaxID=3154598 RepID=UPI0033D90BF4
MSMIGTAAMLAAMLTGMTVVPAAAQLPDGPALQVTAGAHHTCARAGDGKAYCWGDGAFGQLGDVDTANRSRPVAVAHPAAGVTFTELVAGAFHTCGLGSDTKAYCWGQGMYGQLGNGTTANRSSPVAVSAPAAGVTFTQLAAGFGHTCGLGSDTKAYCWGDGYDGQLGNGDTEARLSPAAVSAPAGVAFSQLTAGTSHTCGLGSDTKAYCWGQGGYGQLGNGTTADRSRPVAVIAPAAGVTFTKLAAGGSHTCGLGSDTKAYCWGAGFDGQLGNGATADRSRPVPVIAPAAGVTFTELTAAVDHTCGVGSDRKAYCWGRGDGGKLGNGDSANRANPVAVSAPAGVTFTQLTGGDFHTCGLESNGKAYCWGAGFYGQLGNGATADRASPVAVIAPATGVTFTELTAGDYHTCGLGGDAKAYCWGYGFYGQLGNGATADRASPVAVIAPATGITFTELAVGTDHTCGLGSDTKPYCWGRGAFGQLGNGIPANRSSPVAVIAPAAGVTFTQLVAGYGHTCGLASDAKAYCWGQGLDGQLGDGATVDRASPVAVAGPVGVGFTQLAAGAFHTCGLGSDTKAYCWGRGLSGQLGDGATVDRASPVAVTAPATGVTFTELAGGGYHTCGLGSDTKAYCWGEGGYGQLGDGSSTGRLSPVVVIAPGGVAFTQLAAGFFHTCGLSSSNKAYCGGAGFFGQLGNGATGNRSGPVAVTAPAG